MESPGQRRLPRALSLQPLRRFPARVRLLSASSSRASSDRVARSAVGARSQTLVLRPSAAFSWPTGRRIVPRSTWSSSCDDIIVGSPASKPGEAARILEALRYANVNLLAFSGFPQGRNQAQIDVVTDDLDGLKA